MMSQKKNVLPKLPCKVSSIILPLLLVMGNQAKKEIDTYMSIYHLEQRKIITKLMVLLMFSLLNLLKFAQY